MKDFFAGKHTAASFKPEEFYAPPKRQAYEVHGLMKWVIGLTIGAAIFAIGFTTGAANERIYNIDQGLVKSTDVTKVTPKPTPSATSATVTPKPVVSASASPAATSSSTTALSQSYENTDWKFSVHYPGNWQWSWNANTAFAGSLKDNLDAKPLDSSVLSISVMAAAKVDSPKTAGDYIDQLSKNMGVTLTTSPIVVAGVGGLSYVDPVDRKGSDNSYNIVLVPDNGYVYVLAFQKSTLSATEQAVLDSFTVLKK